MAGAGFYAIHTDKLTFAADGRWYADDEAVEHKRLARLFSRHMRRKPDGSYEIWIDEQYHADVEVEDTPFVVIAVRELPDGALAIQLNDESEEHLRADSLFVGANDVLYSRIKNAAESARFLRSAYQQLAGYIQETEPGRFAVEYAERRYPIAPQPPA